MPIKPENRARYPHNWKDIRAQILERAGHRCEHEGCGIANYTLGYWHDGEFVTEYADTYGDNGLKGAGATFGRFKIIRIVLTIAHLDHIPENCHPDNLRAWCQRHHLAYDHDHHLQNARETRRLKLANKELFGAAA